MRDYAEDDEQQTEKHLQSLATLEDSSNFTGSNKFTSACVHVITMWVHTLNVTTNWLFKNGALLSKKLHSNPPTFSTSTTSDKYSHTTPANHFGIYILLHLVKIPGFIGTFR